MPLSKYKKTKAARKKAEKMPSVGRGKKAAMIRKTIAARKKTKK